MKNLLLLILIAAIGAGWYVWQKQNADMSDNIEIMPTTQKPDPSDATFEFEDGLVTLRGGRADTNLSPESAISTETTLSETREYGDVNGDGKNDTVVILIQSGSGSGIFVYLAAYISGNVEYKGTNAVFIGDRISPQSISINDTGVITVRYLDRRADEPMAAEPTVSASKSFVYRAGRLEER